MRAHILALSLLTLLGLFSPSIKAQNVNEYSINITDHNGNNDPVNIDCSYSFNPNHCITLNAEYPDIKSTSQYSLSSIPFNPIGDFSEGDEIVIDSDDKWSNVQTLPFNFCFYENTFNSIIVGDNGVISFDTQFTGTECPYIIVGSIPDDGLTYNAIFGAYHDMTNDDNVFGCTKDCGKISMYVTGIAPFRKAIINYYKMNHFGCEEVKSTLQIVLYETTNIIDVYIKDKPLTCDIGNEKRALVGILNGDGTQGISPDGRNTGIWETQNEAWRFSPDGKTTTTINWLDSNHNLIGTEKSVDVCPQKNSSYSVEITYNICKPVTLSNSIRINYTPEYPTAKDVVTNHCFEGTTPKEIVDFEDLIPQAIGDQTGLNTSLHTSISDAISGENPISGLNSYEMTSLSKTFYLRVEKNNNCFAVSSLSINLKRKPNLIEGDNIVVCDEGNDNSEIIYLQNYNSEITGYESWMNLKYYTSYNDALSNNGSISNIKLSNTTTIYVKADNPDDNDCFSIIPITFTLQSVIKAESISVSLCDDNIDEIEVYDLTLYESTIAQKEDFSFKYYKTLEDATKDTNPIANPKSYTVKSGTIIYVKIFNPNFCPTIKTISFSFKNTAIKNISDILCDQGQGPVTVDLFKYYNELTEGYDTDFNNFYYTYQGAIKQEASLIISDPENFTIKTPFSSAYVRFFDKVTGCYFVREIKLYFSDKGENTRYYKVCDFKNDGEEIIQLSTLSVIFGSAYPDSVIVYYATLEDQKNDINPITEIKVTNKTSVFVRIKAPTGCSFLYEIELELIPFDIEEKKNISLCDNLNDGQENYNLNSLIPNLNVTNYSSIKFYQTEANAYEEINAITNTNSYNINSVNNKIYARFNFTEGCPKIIPIQFNLLESVIIPNLKTIEVCDSDKNNTENIDLTQIISENSIDTNKILVEFYYSQNGAESQNSNDKIKNYTDFIVTKSNTTIYVRFQNLSTGCFNVKPLSIKMNLIPTVINTILSTCNFANNGEEQVVLSTLNPQLVSNTNGLSFSYYLNHDDALNSKNPLTKYTLNNSISLYVRVSSGVNCFIIEKINFKLLIPPEVINKTIEICDNNDDNQEVINLTIYENILTDSQNNYTFSYFTTYDHALNNTYGIVNPKNYTIENFPVTIFVRVKNNLDCFSIAELTFKAANVIKAENKIVNMCDDNSDMQEYIDITKYIPEMLNTSNQNLSIQYYKTEVGANNKNNQDLITNPVNFSITLAQTFIWVRFDNLDTGCYTIRYIEANLIAPPKLINGKFVVCDTNLDGIYTLDLDELKYVVTFNPQGYIFSYFHSFSDASLDLNKIQNHHQYKVDQFNEDIFVKVTNQYGCSSVKKVTLYTIEKIPVNSQNIQIVNCDDDFDGITTFNLNTVTSSLTHITNAEYKFYSTFTDAQNQLNPIINTTDYTNINPNNDKVYVRISSAEYCPSIGIINLKVAPLPISPLAKELKICPNGTLVIDAGSNPNIVSYLWSTGETTQKITIDKAGIYSVTLTGVNKCSATYTTHVVEYSSILITDLAEGEDYIKVIAEGPSPLEYSMDNIKWQTDNTFYNLSPGVYTFYVRSKANGCISPQKKGVLFKPINVITPNGDGKNDTWYLCDLENFDSRPSHIKIFDRHGKIIFQQSSNTCFIWNGLHLGRPLPSTSYWYVIEIADGRQFTGWIILRNYNDM